MKLKKVFLVLAIISIFFSITVSANSSYKSYNYSVDTFTSLPSPNGYEISDTIYLSKIPGVGNVINPQDIYVANNKIYVLDSGNGRVIILNNEFKLISIISQFKDKTGAASPLNMPSGIFADDNNFIYVADTENNRVVKINNNGEILLELKQPETKVLGKDFVFMPTKVVCDSLGSIYVLSKGLYYGAALYDKNGKFQSFYGNNKVELSPKLIADQFWKKLFGKDLSGQFQRYLPTEYYNFDIGKDNFIVTTTRKTNNFKDEIKLLNPIGNNILPSWRNQDNGIIGNYGDVEIGFSMGVVTDSEIIDVVYDQNGYITCLDFIRGRVFQYDIESNLLCVFGGKKPFEGNFNTPVAIEQLDNDIIVLDAFKSSISTFSLTDYGKSLHNALDLYNNGKYQEAIGPWKEVSKINSNFELAYTGIGKALLQQKDYKSAMECFKLGQDKQGYSSALKYYRSEIIKNNFTPFFIILLIIIVLCILNAVFKWTKRIKAHWQSKSYSKYSRDFYNSFKIMRHPVEIVDSIKYTYKGNVYVAGGIVLLAYFVTIIKVAFTGFAFNYSDPNNFNILFLLLPTVFVFVLFVITNWSVSVFTDGEAKFRDLFICCAYSLWPLILITILSTILSNFITLEENMFYVFVNLIGIIWSSVLIIISVSELQQFSLGKTIANILFTLLGMAIVIFVILMIFSLIGQVITFIQTISSELFYRM